MSSDLVEGEIFNVKKSGILQITYKIESKLFDGNIIKGKRSRINFLAFPFFFIFAAIPFLYGGANTIQFLLSFSSPSLFFLANGVIGITVAIIILQLINIPYLRRIHVYDHDKSSIGTIKGSLLQNRWKMNTEFGKEFTTLHFSARGGKGKLNTSYDNYFVSKIYGENIAQVHDSKEGIIFIVNALDSSYRRKSFKIESFGQLNKFLICLITICMIERYFQPVRASGPHY